MRDEFFIAVGFLLILGMATGIVCQMQPSRERRKLLLVICSGFISFMTCMVMTLAWLVMVERGGL